MQTCSFVWLCDMWYMTDCRKQGAGYLVLRAAQQGAGAGIEDGICGGARGGSLLGDLIVQVLDHNLVAALVQHGKAVAGYEDS